MRSLPQDSLHAGSGQEPHNGIPHTGPTPKGHEHIPWVHGSQAALHWGNDMVLNPDLELHIP